MLTDALEPHEVRWRFHLGGPLEVSAIRAFVHLIQAKLRQAERAVALAVETFGKIDILVKNAGRILYRDMVDMTREEWDWQMQTNVTGAFPQAL